jgi:hypothetical protein
MATSFILSTPSKNAIIVVFIGIYFNIMEKNINNTVDQFLSPKVSRRVSNDSMEREECDLQTGECYVIRSKDGIVERINKKYITEDGRQLLQD